MPLKKIVLKSGVNRENTRYTSEGGWYDCNKIRFRQGTPEKIGGWQCISSNEFLGTCRFLWPWVTNDYVKYLGVGTNLKSYIMWGGQYYDITPIRSTDTLTNPFTATNGSAVITVSDVAHGCVTGDFVTFSGTTGLGGNITSTVLNAEYQITRITDDSYSFVATATANATDAAGSPGGGTVTAAYQVNTGNAIQVPLSGWGGGVWGGGTWGIGSGSTEGLRVWNLQNYGEDLLYGPQGGAMYYWTAAGGLNIRGVALSSLPGASDVPLMQNLMIIADSARIALVFGTNDFGSAAQDPMLIRWSAQEDVTNWTPATTNQAGSIRLSHGSTIKAVLQVRQEIIVWTDTALYSLQYLTNEPWWSSQLMGDNVSIISDRAMATASGATYWMGNGKFFSYDGNIGTLVCDIRQYIFDDINLNQQQQIFATTVTQYNEVWWFYCSAASDTIDRYAVYNYVEKIWYYGSIERTAWIDSSIVSDDPISAGMNNRLIYQEVGADDNATDTTLPIESYITSAEFDIEDGNSFGFVWRVLPDITFRGSSAANPQATMYLLPLQNSGSGYNDNSSTNANQSVAGTSYGAITRTAVLVVEEFTGQINTRVRGRQMSIKVESTGLGVTWQLGAPRIDIRPDGRKS